MIKIDKIAINIDAYASDNHSNVRKFGRKLEFKQGLNLVVGDNTTGKTTITKCLFYCLGMEELIDGKKGIGSMDKSVKDVFIDKTSEESKEWNVITSSVTIQISNSKGEILTIRRNIKDKVLREHILYVWRTNMTNEMDVNESKEFYIHRENDHETSFHQGFYALLSRFADLPIVEVVARNSDKGTILYMQTLFALTYIEQTRGWSDFFANIRSFNIINPKQRIIEYVMGYTSGIELDLINNLKSQKKKLGDTWEDTVKTFRNYLSYNHLTVCGLEYSLTKQKIAIDELRYSVSDENIPLGQYIQNLKQKILDLQEKQNRSNLQQEGINNEYDSLLAKYYTHKNKYNEYCVNLNTEIEKSKIIQQQLNIIKLEIKRYSSLAQVNNIINNSDVKICPTCHQPLPTSADYEFSISMEQINESKNILNMKKAFLEPMLKRFEQTVKNKKLNKCYLEEQLSKERAELRLLASQNDINLSPLSPSELFDLVNYNNQLATLERVENEIKNNSKDLSTILTCYLEIKSRIDKLNKNNQSSSPLNKQLKQFKYYLNRFNYSSNYVDNHVFFKEEDSTYKYLPVIVTGEYEEDIRSDSSASDFIRSIWAYYLTLLSLGPHHPGFLVMDEPCQHSIKEESLKNLFSQCSQLTDQQIILFCSSQPHTEEFLQGKRKGIHTRNIIHTLVESLENSSQINYIDIEPIAIIPIEN